MFFGGFSGGVSFYPDKVEDPSYTPPMVLTDFELSGNSVPIGPQSLLQRPITYESDLTLSHSQSVFSLEFSTLNYLNAVANRYRYKLEGLDREWTEVGSDRRIATYTTLPAGRYTFHVQGAARRGPWSEQVMALAVSGLLNKQIGAPLGISETTVKAHRGHVMRKMEAHSFADLVVMDSELPSEPERTGSRDLSGTPRLHQPQPAPDGHAFRHQPSC